MNKYRFQITIINNGSGFFFTVIGLFFTGRNTDHFNEKQSNVRAYLTVSALGNERTYLFVVAQDQNKMSVRACANL